MAKGIAPARSACQAIALALALAIALAALPAAGQQAPRGADDWLGEALPEYLAFRYLEQHEPAAARRMLERALEEALAAKPLRPLARGARLYEEAGAEIARATLRSRGMLVLRTLEAAIGRRRVDAAIGALYQRHGGRATTAQFRAICEEIAARDLDWFFRYYIDGTALPEIELRRLPDAAPGEFAGEIVLANVPEEFTLRVELRLDTAEGSIEHSLATRGLRTPFTVNVPGPVLRVTLDPHLRILRRSPR